jgi:hypothetical protein
MFVVVVAISLRLFLVLFVVVYVVAEFPLGLSMEVAQFFASGVVPPPPLHGFLKPKIWIWNLGTLSEFLMMA